MDVRTAASKPPNEYIGGQVIAAAAVTFPIVLITLAFRLYSRIWIVKSPGWDDWTIILATCCSLIQLIFNSLFLRWGGARHVIYLTKVQRVNARKFSNLAFFPFTFCTAITKVSVAFMVIRLSGERWMRRCMYALIASLVFINGACIIVLFAYCRPSRAFWDPVPHAKCWDTKVLVIASNIQGAWSIITDLICTLMPLVMVWRLQMNKNQKIAITVLIGFGLATTACCIGRVVDYNSTEPNDATWTGVSTIIWTTLEDNIGLIAANLPPLGSFGGLIREKLKTSSSMRYLLSRGTRSYEKTSGNQPTVVTIGRAPNHSRDSDIELIRAETKIDLRYQEVHTT